MPGLLNKAASEAQRRENNRHQPLVVVAALSVLAVYMYLFTQVAVPLGLPLPEELISQLGLSVRHVFDNDGNVDSNLVISMTQRFDRNDDERLVFFLLLTAAFLTVYFLPHGHKQPAIVGWTTLTLLALFGIKATSALLFAHLIVYLVLHPNARHSSLASGLAGLCAWLAFVFDFTIDIWVLVGLLLPPMALVLHRYGLARLMSLPRAASIVRPVVVHSAIVFMCISVMVEGSGGAEWKLAKGLLMFFWQWPRVAMYYVDYNDGHVPEDLPLTHFLSVFVSPGVIPNWNWGVAIPQGYASLNSNFLAKDKNILVMDGIRILGVAMLYLVTWSWVRYALVDIFADLGIPLYRARTHTMVKAFMGGEEISTASVLLTTFFDLFRFMMYLGGVLHFKVGVWRLMGYDVAPYYNHFWLSTNLATIWSRFAFHYREFCVRVFYYPVFFRFFTKYPMLRVFIATMAAAIAGNLLWHISERIGFNGFEWKHLVYRLGTWPYFVSLGLGIAAAQIYLMKRKRHRKPWRLDRWLITDVLAAYVTIQYFALIHIFARPARGSSVWDLTRLVLKGFGLHID